VQARVLKEVPYNVHKLANFEYFGNTETNQNYLHRCFRSKLNLRGVFSNVYLPVLLSEGKMCGNMILIVCHVCETGSPIQGKSFELMILENRGTWLVLRARE
jgi:hypothetical protein